jgi:hypothetical protein
MLTHVFSLTSASADEPRGPRQARRVRRHVHGRTREGRRHRRATAGMIFFFFERSRHDPIFFLKDRGMI